MKITGLALVVIALSLLSAPLPAAAQPSDREFQRLISSLADDKLRDDASNRVWAAGTPAVPFLVKGLSDPDVKVRKASLQMLDAMFTLNPQVLTDISVSLPPLLSAVPTLFGLFADADEQVRHSASMMIGSAARLALRVRPDMGSAILANVMEALSDQNEQIRIGAARTMADLSGTTEIPLPPMETLKDENPTVRERVAWTIGAGYRRCQVSPDCRVDYRVAIPFLRDALGDAEPSVRQSAALALGAIDPGSKDAITVLAETIQTSEGYGAILAVKALREISPGDTVRVLVGIVQRHGGLSVLAMATLREMRPTLDQLSHDPNADVSESARTAIALLDASIR